MCSDNNNTARLLLCVFAAGDANIMGKDDQKLPVEISWKMNQDGNT